MRLILSLFFLISANVFGDISVCQNCEKKSCFELQDKQARIECQLLQKHKINEITKFIEPTKYLNLGVGVGVGVLDCVYIDLTGKKARYLD